MLSSHVRRLSTALLLLAACSSGGDGGTEPDPNQGGGGTGGGNNQVLTGTIEVRLTGASFSPANITIAKGSTVRWINDSGIFHTITPETATQTGVWEKRETNTTGLVFEHKFDTAGQTYRYRCEPHSSNFTQGMVGSITVQ